MTYSEKANPNATNSELDAKVVITQPELSDTQRDELTSQYVEIVVDNMSEKDLVRYAIEQLTSYYNEDSIESLKEDIDSYDPDLYDELVDNVTQQYPKQLNTFDEERYIQALMKEVN